jgi:RND family efflux transporter MFP subunit
MKSYDLRKTTFISLSLVILVGLLTGCQNKQANANAPPPPPMVTVSKPVTKDVIHYAEFTGTTEASETVTIRARVEGYLEKILFTEGAMVQQGDLLFIIDQKPYLARLDEARAELAMRRAELRLARATKTRKENALLDDAVSEVEVIDARAQQGKAEAGVKAAEAALRTARLNLSYTQVTAPISGRISRSQVDVGNLVGAIQRTELTTIVKDDPVYAFFTISERDWVRYQAGRTGAAQDQDPSTPVHMGLSGRKDFPYTGRLDFIDNHADAATGTIQLRAIFNNDDHRILPGLFARIRIPIGATSNALLVPDSAVGRDQQGRFLLVANPENITEYRPVTAGEVVDGLRVIRSGLKDDERVIVNGLQKARPGTPVTPTNPKTDTKPAQTMDKRTAINPSVDPSV